MPVPTKADPDYTEPPEAHYPENGVRYLQASIVSEPEETPDVTDVTFVIAPTLARHGPQIRSKRSIFSRRNYAKAPGQALFPDAVAVGLVNTALNRSARALSKAGDSLDKIASRRLPRQGRPAGKRNQIYSDTLVVARPRGREDLEPAGKPGVDRAAAALPQRRTGRPEHGAKAVREATKTALRDLQSLEEDASFKAQKVQFLLDATLGLINLAQNDIIKLFSVLAVIFMPPTVIASIYGMNFKVMPELEWRWGYPMAHRPDDLRRGAALPLLPLEEVALGGPCSSQC